MHQVYRICNRCIMDTSDPEIRFDTLGHCNHCIGALARMREQLLPPEERARVLSALITRIKDEGKDKEYDCIIGVSGGVDSTHVAYLVRREWGLRPLAVHFDNGWNSELAVDNIARILDGLEIDLYTHVVEWEEFRDLQVAFLKASLANAEAPTDHGINALLPAVADEKNLRYILSGSNIATETIMPYAWGHYNQDLKLLKAIHQQFGSLPLRTMPLISIQDYLFYFVIQGIRQVPILNYIDYRKEQAKETLKRELGWRDYGGKHYESIWTRFFQGYYLPVKFGYDKRRAHLSTLICSGQMTRGEALSEMEKPIYDFGLLEQDKHFVLKKLRLDEAEFERIMKAPPTTARDYPSQYLLFHRLEKYKNLFRWIITSPRV